MTYEEDEEKKQLRVIVCRPGEVAEIVEIEDRLEVMQEIVGGLIEEWDPFYSESDKRYENVLLICNDEGKLLQLPKSRAIYDEDWRFLDKISGPFFICYGPVESESFESLPPDLEEEFYKRFELPEKFYETERGTMMIRYDPRKQPLERDEAR